MADIGQQFQSILGRAPTPAEMDYFNQFISRGELAPHEISSILQSTPEYQSAQLTKNTAQYGQALQANDANVLSQAADKFGAQAQSRFAGLGRPNSSAMAAQVFGQGGQLAGQLAQSRQSALADFYGRGLQQSAALGAQQGMNTTQTAYGRQAQNRQFDLDNAMYTRQQNDYNNAKNASSGWNAITPEFAVSQALRAGMAYGTGGMSEIGGLFGGGSSGSASSGAQLNYINKNGAIGGYR